AANAGRVVDHDVDTAERVCRCGNEVLNRVGVQGVTDDGDDLAARLVRQRSGRFLQRSFGPGADGDVAALERGAGDRGLGEGSGGGSTSSGGAVDRSAGDPP